MRLLAFVAGLGLLVLPAFLLFGATIPVARFRAGDYTDYVLFAETLAVVHGGAILGAAFYWLWVRNTGTSARLAGVFRAGVAGAGVAGLALILASGVYGQVMLGSFERGVGTLWGMILIFVVVLGAIVAAGLALLWLAWQRPPAGGPTPGPWASGSGLGRLPAG